MDMYKVKWTQLQAEILRILCIKAGMSFNLRTLAKLTKRTPTAVSNVLPALEKDSLITIKKSENMNLLAIELNRNHIESIEFKRVENLRLLYESKLVNYLKETFQGSTIILFGSYSKGEDTVESDIDITIIGAKEKEIDLTTFDKLLQRTISLQFFDSFNDIHKHLRENIFNGILLNGGVEL